MRHFSIERKKKWNEIRKKWSVGRCYTLISEERRTSKITTISILQKSWIIAYSFKGIMTLWHLGKWKWYCHLGLISSHFFFSYIKGGTRVFFLKNQCWDNNWPNTSIGLPSFLSNFGYFRSYRFRRTLGSISRP